MNSMYMSFYGFFFPINDFLKKFLYHGKFQTYKSKENSLLNAHSVQFSSVTQSCPTLGDPMNRSTPGLPVHHQLPGFTQTHVHQVSDAIQPSSSVIPFSSCPQSLPASGSFPMSQLFAWGGQSIGVTASASVLPMNTQDRSPHQLIATTINLLSDPHLCYFEADDIFLTHKRFSISL